MVILCVEGRFATIGTEAAIGCKGITAMGAEVHFGLYSGVGFAATVQWYKGKKGNDLLMMQWRCVFLNCILYGVVC